VSRVYERLAHFSTRRDLFDLDTRFLHYNNMFIQIQKGRIALAIKALRTTSRLSVRSATKAYDILESTFYNRIKSCTPKAEERNAQHNLISTEEETLVQYILDLDSRGFPLQLDDIQSMVDLLCKTYNAKLVGKQ